MRDYQVDLVLAVEGALRTGESGTCVEVIEGVTKDSIVVSVVSSVICSLESELPRFLFFISQWSMIGVRSRAL